MFVGKRYKLRTLARAIETINKELKFPAGEIVEVIADPLDDSDGLIDVVLEGRRITMHISDMKVNATEIL